MRDVGDVPQMRQAIFDKSLQAARSLPPITTANSAYSLHLADVDYADAAKPKQFGPKEHQNAVMRGETLGRKLSGTWQLKDAAGKVTAERRAALADVPWLTNDGSMVIKGTPYVMGYQLRQDAGVYHRQKENGELEAHINPQPGGGSAHRLMMEPHTGIFRMKAGQSMLPLYTILKGMGATHADMEAAWGRELADINRGKDDPKALDKLHDKMVRKPVEGMSPADRQQAGIAALQATKLDDFVTRHTLGEAHPTVTAKTYLQSTQKLLRIAQGIEDVDDRDSPAFQRIFGPEDLIAERIGRDKNSLRRHLWRGALTKNLDHIPSYAFQKSVLGAVQQSGLGLATEGVNPGMLLDQLHRVTKLGEGGIAGGAESVPAEARSVQPGQFGFIDPNATPESSAVGVEGRLASGVRKGDDNRLYAPFLNRRTGETEYKSPRDMLSHSVAYPGELNSGKRWVSAVKHGKLAYVKADDADYEMPDMSSAFAALDNMVPMKSAMKGHRAAMAQRMLSQAVPLVSAEAPHVQSAAPDGESYENKYAHRFGAVKGQVGGSVVQVGPNNIQVRGDDGQVVDHPLYDQLSYARKTGFYQTPLVQQGQRVKPGQLLAKSNYTDHQGTAALGKNFRVAWMPWHGYNFEDAVVMSESAAKSSDSEHHYQHVLDPDENTVVGKHAYVAINPSKYTKKLLDNYERSGLPKIGTELKFGDPLWLAVKEREDVGQRAHGGKAASWADATETWEHHHPGTVVGVEPTKTGHTIMTKTVAPTVVGDKFCYDPATEVLTSAGWKPVATVTLFDKVATLDPLNDELCYMRPHAMHVYDHKGRMYAVESTQVSLCVTDNHKLYAKGRYDHEFDLVTAESVFGTRYRMKRNVANWHGCSPKYIELPPVRVKAGQGGVTWRWLPAKRLPVDTYITLLGMFLSEGNCFGTNSETSGGNFGIEFTQLKPDSRQKMLAALRALGYECNDRNAGGKTRLYGIHLMEHFKQFGHSHEKFIPPEVFGWETRHLQLLYDWLMWGDGSTGGTGHSYCTTSKQLADDVQRLTLHIGMSANITSQPAARVFCFGKWLDARARYDVRIYRHKNEPQINHGHTKTQNAQSENWIDYDGPVYCVEMPEHHVIYVRRNNKPVWCGNSNRFGGKGVLAAIVPDDQMPHGKDGKPYDMAFNSLGVISRTNPASIHETLLGKIVERKGVPAFSVKDFNTQDTLDDFVDRQIKRHGVEGTEDLTDPTRGGATIPNVLTGNSFFMKLHHLADAKEQGRGMAGYTAEGRPSKGGYSGSKKLSLLNMSSYLSHGATAGMRDALVNRGQAHPEFWRRFVGGHSEFDVGTPQVNQKFLALLNAGGINTVKQGRKLQLLAMTNKDVDALTEGRELANAETLDWNRKMAPIRGGLFDPGLGGRDGDKWSALRLAEPMLNPAMEEPTRRLLGLTEAKFRSVLAGREELAGKSGPSAIHDALKNINVPEAIAKARLDIGSGRKTKRDEAIRKLHYLKMANDNDLHPGEWVLDKVPVLPPKFRPISQLPKSKVPLISDPNLLYRDLHEANNQLGQVKDKMDDVGDERLAVYDGLKAVVGLGDPIQPKTQEKGVKGVLRSIFGSSPKHGYVQSKLLSANTDLVGRGVIVPDPNLGIDEIGIPENSAWSIYSMFTARDLVRSGMDRVQALREVKDRSPLAKKTMQQVMERRPIVADRAPVLHRYGTMAFKPKIMPGSTMRVPAAVCAGFGADFDGDAMQFHVPFSDDSVKDAWNKMLPSKNLLSTDSFRAHQLPSKEYGGGLWEASAHKNTSKRAKVFRTLNDVVAAFNRGEVAHDHPIEVTEARYGG